jgi:predicted outer membrane protein
MLMATLTNRIGLVASLLLASVAMGCDDGDDADDNNDDSSDPDVQSARDAGDARGRELATQAMTEIGGDNSQVTMQKSASIIHTINDGEIMQASAVLELSNDADVQAFARMIIRDHGGSNERLEAMLQGGQLPVQDNPISAALRTEAVATTAELGEMPPGELPRAYLKMQVQMHQEAFVLVSALVDIADNGNPSGGGTGSDDTSTFAQFMRETQDMIAGHRDEAADRLSEKNDQARQP